VHNGDHGPTHMMSVRPHAVPVTNLKEDVASMELLENQDAKERIQDDRNVTHRHAHPGLPGMNGVCAAHNVVWVYEHTRGSVSMVKLGTEGAKELLLNRKNADEGVVPRGHSGDHGQFVVSNVEEELGSTHEFVQMHKMTMIVLVRETERKLVIHRLAHHGHDGMNGPNAVCRAVAV